MECFLDKLAEYINNLKKVKTLSALEDLRVEVLGKKGFLTDSFTKLKDLSSEEKAKTAKELNKFKLKFTELLEEKRVSIAEINAQKSMFKNKLDVSLLSPTSIKGSFHPLSLALDRIINFFTNCNFSIEDGPLIEDDFHNFEALNIPKYHPARAMQDTFYFNADRLLRTHTSPVQIRTMRKSKAPIRIISPGIVFRRDYDVTHTPMFTQVEGLVVAEGGMVSLSNLKYILNEFLKYIFGNVKIRYRVSYFPFTEPSAEIDIGCIFCNDKGCNICSNTGWIEVLGCGLVNQNVFNSVGYENVSGYAFGIGVERFAMLMHKITDLRSMFETDLRLLEQF